MAPVRFGRLRAKRPYGFRAKVTLAVFLGLCFIVVWSIFSSPSSSVTSQRSSFSDISIPVSSDYKNHHLNPTPIPRLAGTVPSSSHPRHQSRAPPADDGVEVPVGKNKKGDADVGKRVTDGDIGGGSADSVASEKDHEKANEEHGEEMTSVQKKKQVNHHQQQVGSVAQSGTKAKEPDNNKDEVQSEGDEKDEDVPDEDIEIDGDVVQGDDDSNASTEQEPVEKMEDENAISKTRIRKKKKNVGPLFDSRARYSWKLCSVRSKHNYIPCIDIEGTTGKLQSYRHRERSCPAAPPMCLISLPEGFGPPVRWPERKTKV